MVQVHLKDTASTLYLWVDSDRGKAVSNIFIFIIMDDNFMKRIAILQSNYIPWKGYFDIINSVDEFVLYDEVQYTKNDWRNRNQIKTVNGSQWLTIPVRRTSLTQKINETRTDGNRWRKKHWHSICQWYAKSSYLKTYRDHLETLYMGDDEENLSAINQAFIHAVCKIIHIPTAITSSTDYHLTGGRSERLLSLCQQARATSYLSGLAAKDYLDVGLFEAAGIEVAWMDYTGYPAYGQLYSPPFIHEVSILDLILNKGGDNAKKYMLSSKTG
jgi:hypothetical protein